MLLRFMPCIWWPAPGFRQIPHGICIIHMAKCKPHMRMEQLTGFNANESCERNSTLGLMQTPHAKGTVRLVLCKLTMRMEQHTVIYAKHTREWNRTLEFMQIQHANSTTHLFLCIIYLTMCIIHFSSHEK